MCSGTRIMAAAFTAIIVLLLAGCSGLAVKGRPGYTISWDFDHEIGSEWSTNRTFDLGGNKVLGIFNDRNRKYPTSAKLQLDKIPVNRPIHLSFDLYFIGSWDSGGPLADRWTLRIQGGDTLIDMRSFDYAFKDGKHVRPHGVHGTLDTGRRILNYHSVDQEVTITPDQIHSDSLTLVFRGYLTGHGTEFWALDNVRIAVGE